MPAFLCPQVADAAELRKLEEARQRALAQRDVQNQQLEELKARILAERAADKKEGALLRQRAEKVWAVGDSSPAEAPGCIQHDMCGVT